MMMRRVIISIVLGALALALASCMTPPTQYNPPGSGSSQIGGLAGGEGYGSGTYVPPPASTTRPPPLKDASVDKEQSAALTNYLKSHRLPLVGASVLVSPSGQRQLMLYGFVATQYGKNDAEAKARRYLNDPNIGVDNQIQVHPQLAQGSSGAPSSSSAYDPSIGGVQAYENQQAQDAYQQAQINQYQQQSQGPSMLTTLVPLLGFFGGSFGGGGFGGGFGGFGPYGTSPYGGYGYPAMPPPGFGYGNPYAPWP
jgi:hypothetical protein